MVRVQRPPTLVRHPGRRDRASALAAAAGGALLGLTASRLLYDLAPWIYGALGSLPGALALAALGALAAFALAYFLPTPPAPAHWAPLALLLVTLFAPTVNPLRDLTLLLGALVLMVLLHLP